jgi:hypothetical protein
MENEEIQDVQPEIEQDVEITLEEETPTEETVEIDWKAEALKQKAINQRLSKKISSPEKPKQDLPTKQDDDIRLTVKELQMAEKKRQFGYEHGLSPEETDAVFKLSPNPNKEVLDDPFVKGGLSALRAKKRVIENTPSASKSSFREALKKQDVTPDELDNAWEKDIQEKLNRRK